MSANDEAVARFEAEEAISGPYFAGEIRNVGFGLPVRVAQAAPGLHALVVGEVRVVTTSAGLRLVQERIAAYLAALEVAAPPPAEVVTEEAA